MPPLRQRQTRVKPRIRRYGPDRTDTNVSALLTNPSNPATLQTMPKAPPPEYLPNFWYQGLRSIAARMGWSVSTLKRRIDQAAFPAWQGRSQLGKRKFVWTTCDDAIRTWYWAMAKATTEWRHLQKERKHGTRGTIDGSSSPLSTHTESIEDKEVS